MTPTPTPASIPADLADLAATREEITNMPSISPQQHPVVRFVTMEQDRRSVAPRSRFAAASVLQKLLPHVAALTLAARQARWNVSARGADEVCDLLDHLIEDSTMWTDRVAERLVESGFTADARPTTVSATGTQLRAGRLSPNEAASAMVELLTDVDGPALDAVVALETADPDGLGIVVEILEALGWYAAGFDSLTDPEEGPTQ